MTLWIPITIVAAFFQNVRNSLQRHLLSSLSPEGASYLRFLYAVPFTLLYFTGLRAYTGEVVSLPRSEFVVFALMGGVAQILATVFLIRAFSLGSFAVGTALSKTEALYAALFGFVLLGEGVSLLAIAGILISLVGVAALSLAGKDTVEKRWVGAGALYGLVSGALFAFAAVTYRGAALSVASENFLVQAGYTQLCVTVVQALSMGGYIAWRDRSELRRIIQVWRPAILVGLTGMLASGLWLIAMALERAAYVRTLGQIDLIFAFVVSTLIFRERATARDVVGVALIATGLALVVLA